ERRVRAQWTNWTSRPTEPADARCKCLGKIALVTAGDVARLQIVDIRALLDPCQSIADIAREAATLGLFAIVDDVDAKRDLFPHSLLNCARHSPIEFLGGARARRHQLRQIVWARQRASV